MIPIMAATPKSHPTRVVSVAQEPHDPPAACVYNPKPQSGHLYALTLQYVYNIRLQTSGCIERR